MSWILTRREDECLVKLCIELVVIAYSEVRCLLFDGCVVQSNGEGARGNIENVLRKTPSLIGMRVAARPWGSSKLDAAPLSGVA